MKAFICVYRHPVPSKRSWQKVMKAAERQPLLQKFLDGYDNTGSFYDWGDDPSFFAAREILGDSSYATWGVCRRDVRKQLTPGDLVIYFCARQHQEEAKIWDYYFVGFGTVKETILRRQLWEDSRYSIYKGFFNLLAKPTNNGLAQYEPFGFEHRDWEKRSLAPYIIFDRNEELTNFNIANPIHVATKLPNSPVEKWHSSNKSVKKLKDILFGEFNIKRRLRTGSEWHAHRQIAIHSSIPRDERQSQLHNLRAELREVAWSVRMER